MNEKINLLDHGFIRLVDSMGNDLSVVRSARVSYDAAWRAGENTGSDKRLIEYLMSHNHNTPFESVQLTFEIKAPIFVFRQWHRHRTWSFNELSARYKELPEEFYVPDPELIGTQSEDNKQMRDIESTHDMTFQRSMALIIYRTNKESFKNYKYMLKLGVPRELARSVLPVSTYSHMFASVNLHNLFKFISERSHEHAQYEIRVYSDAILEILKSIVPECTNSFLKLRSENATN